jgi:hypothetical protein
MYESFTECLQYKWDLPLNEMFSQLLLTTQQSEVMMQFAGTWCIHQTLSIPIPHKLQPLPHLSVSGSTSNSFAAANPTLGLGELSMCALGFSEAELELDFANIFDS